MGVQVVEIINKSHSKESHLIHLIRLLTFYACHYNFIYRAEHIHALFRNNVPFFLSQVPNAYYVVPVPLLTLLALDVAWTSTPWMQLFRNTLQLA